MEITETIQTVVIPIEGMDCAECTMHVRKAIAGVSGVRGVEVFLASEKAIIQVDTGQVSMASIQKAVESAGYKVGSRAQTPEITDRTPVEFTRQVLTLFGIVFAAILFIIVAGEWLGLFEAITERVPWPVGLAIVIIAGYPVFKNVVRAAINRQVIAHTLMTTGVIAALAIGEWATAAVVVFFMRVGDYAESFTTGRARKAVKDLAALAPRTARIEQDGIEVEIPVEAVSPGMLVIVRPGEKMPVDGEVAGGQATIDQATITGESLPVEAGPGARVYAATLLQTGSLRVCATQVGPDTTFGRVIKLVEQAEAQRANVQRLADKFSAYYLPVVAGIAALTFLLRRDPLSTAAVLVVACSCSFALATPIAMLASIGAGARHGLLIKGGKYLERLAQADVLLIDKTGTLTLGKPEITDVLPAGESTSPSDLLVMAASAERYSEHPLADAVRRKARQAGLALKEPQNFVNLPGLGLRAQVDGKSLAIGNRRLLLQEQVVLPERSSRVAESMEAQGKTLLFVIIDGAVAGILAAADTLRNEVPAALKAVQELGIKRIELLTGDNPLAAGELVRNLSARKESQALPISFRANLLPEDKIAIVREYQQAGHTVVMVGDGINDAPALAQADIGIAMGAAGTDIAIEAAHIALMRDDWRLVPEVIRIARRTMAVVKFNIGFTMVYNVVGLSLAALGFLPPIFAAAAQSLPDLGILANSSRLLKYKGISDQ